MSGTGSSTILPAVEQRIGSSSQPLEGAGFDPAFIPGLTSPVTAEPEDKAPAEDAESAESAESAEGAEGVGSEEASAPAEESPAEDE